MKTALTFYIAIIVLWIAGIVGWVMNLVSLVCNFETISVAELVVRVAGIPLFPLGAIVGYF